MPILYNRDMTNTNTKENDMPFVGDRGRYQGKVVLVLSINKYWNEAKVRYVNPEVEAGATKWRSGRWFNIGLPQLKEL